MAKINLLPWREERREQLKKEYFTILGGVALLGVVVVVLWHSSISGAISSQESRNNFLTANIKQLDAQVAEIKELKDQRKRLIERMRIIQELQGNRPEIVRLFDETVRTLPDGVFYTDVERKGSTLTIKGTAESNNRVSSLMRRLDESQWFDNPNLIGVKANPLFGDQANDFNLTVTIAAPSIEQKEGK